MCGLRSLGGRAPETTPRRFNFGVGGPVASCPHLGSGRRIFGYIKPNYGARSAMNQAGALGGLRLRNQSNANGNNAPPAWQHFNTHYPGPVALQVPSIEPASHAQWN